MNLPEYRETVREAQKRFQNTVTEAAEILMIDLMAADDSFFKEQDKIELRGSVHG